MLKTYLSGGSWDRSPTADGFAHLFAVFSEILTSVHHDDKFSSENWSASLAKIKILPKVFVFAEMNW